MSRKSYTLHNRQHNNDLERFKTRLSAKCCVAFIAVTQIITRLIILFTEHKLNHTANILYATAISCLGVMVALVALEFILFKRIGPKVMKYSKILDILLLIFFTIEWLLVIFMALVRIPTTGPPAVPLSAIFSFTSFGWRTLFLLFIIQSWKFTIVPPILAIFSVVAYSIHLNATEPIYTLLRSLPSVFYTIIMLYFLDRIKWREILTNTQQERWIQINDFILNNIPENIVILELGGEVNFVSDYCKAFMRKAHLSQNPQDLFNNIQDLNLLPENELSSPSNTSRHTEKMATLHTLLDPTTGTSSSINSQRVNDLRDLLQNFKSIIRDVNLQERQFLIYNGKLRVEAHHTKSIEIKISYIQQNNKEYIILIIRDTTQRDLLVMLEDNNKYKDQLLASVSHELRAPLNGNINLVESAIQNMSVPDHIKERLLTPALRSSKFLLHLINDILDMSQIKAHRLRLIFKPGKLEDTLQDTLQLVELQAKKKGIELCSVIHPDVQSTLCTDHVRLSQIVLNLLNNAIKFTQKGSIILSAAPAENHSCCTKITVQDSGIGMTREDTKKLFSDYTRIEFSGRQEINPTGVGLGLSIAHNLAKLLGPKGQKGILVESVPGIGSNFSFMVENKDEQLNPQEFAVKKASDKSKSQTAVPDELRCSEPRIFPKLHKSFSTNLIMRSSENPQFLESPNKKCTCAKILVVDDNPFNTMAFETVLGSLNFNCDTVFDGHTAIDRILDRQRTFCGIHCRPYSVVFMDQEMPGLTGSETVQEIKRLQVQGLVPPMKIIGCTAHGSSEEVDKFMESGIEMCIHKPITSAELQKILKAQ